MTLNRKTIILIAIAVITIFLLVAFVGCERIDQGNVGLRVNQTGGDKGQAKVQDASGWQIYLRGATRIFEYPVFQLHKEYDPIDVPALGGYVLTVHPMFNYNIAPDKVKEMFQKFRVDTSGLTNGFIKTAMLSTMREITNTFTVDSILNNLSIYDAKIQEDLNRRLFPYFIVSQFTSNLKPDPKLVQSIQAKAQAIQNAITTEYQQRQIRANAENEIVVARKDSTIKIIRALSEARDIQLKQDVLRQSPQYIEYIKWSRWNGEFPKTMLGSNTNTLLSLDKQ
jgi:hypothetical protein